MAKTERPSPTNKSNFYRNKNSGEISPAFSNPRGYEDEHPEDWEAVSDAEGEAAMKPAAPKVKAAKVDKTADTNKPADTTAAAQIPPPPAPPAAPAIPPPPVK